MINWDIKGHFIAKLEPAGVTIVLFFLDELCENDPGTSLQGGPLEPELNDDDNGSADSRVVGVSLYRPDNAEYNVTIYDKDGVPVFRGRVDRLNIAIDEEDLPAAT